MWITLVTVGRGYPVPLQKIKYELCLDDNVQENKALSKKISDE
jgi:hypothetical protein